MKKNKKILVLLLISIVCAFLFDFIIMNRRVMFKNYSYEPEIVTMEGITFDGTWYRTTTDNAYIVYKTKVDDTYINKIEFDYYVNKDADWTIEYNLNGENISYPCKSSSITDKAIKRINVNVNEIKIAIPHRNFRFKNLQIDNSIYINISRIVFLALALFGFMMLISYRSYFFDNLDKAFLFISIIIGVLAIFVFPKNVYIAWDDQIHIKRAYVLFDKDQAKFSDAFKLLESRGKINNSVFQTREEVEELYKSLNTIHKNTKDDEIQIPSSSAKYGEIVYLPFYLGFKIGDILNLSFIATIILAKLFNYLAYVLLIYFAIKISTTLKKLVFLVGLIPTNIFLATQFSYDPTIIASIILAIALFVRTLQMPKANYKYIFAFVLAIIWASLPKAIYAPLLLLILFVPNQKFKTKKDALKIKAIVMVLMVLLMSTFVLPVLMGSLSSGDARGGNTSVSEQLKFILNNPFNYAKILILFFSTYGADLILGQVAFVHICYLDYYVSMFSPLLYIVYLLLVFYTLYTTSFDKKIITNKIRALFAIIYLMLVVLIFTALYLSFTEVGSNTIVGIQHRYFNPLLLMFLITICATRPECKKCDSIKRDNILLLLIPFVTFILVLFPIVMVGRGM